MVTPFSVILKFHSLFLNRDIAFEQFGRRLGLDGHTLESGRNQRGLSLMQRDGITVVVGQAHFAAHAHIDDERIVCGYGTFHALVHLNEIGLEEGALDQRNGVVVAGLVLGAQIVVHLEVDNGNRLLKKAFEKGLSLQAEAKELFKKEL